MRWLYGLSTTLSSTLTVPPFKFSSVRTALNKSWGVYSSRSQNRLTLSWLIVITSPNRQQVGECGVLNIKDTCIAKVQRAVGGRLIVLINGSIHD